MPENNKNEYIALAQQNSEELSITLASIRLCKKKGQIPEELADKLIACFEKKISLNTEFCDAVKKADAAMAEVDILDKEADVLCNAIKKFQQNKEI